MEEVRRKTLLASGLLLAAWASAGAALTGGPMPLRASLVSETAEPSAEGEFWAGLWLRPDPGWHVYWRNPGDSGYAPSLDWRLPPGWSAEPFLWPLPHAFQVAGIAGYGYEGEVLLMSRLSAPRGSALPAVLEAEAKWLVCKDVCLPGKARLSLELPSRSPQPDLFSKARSQLPQPASESGLAAAARESEGRFDLEVTGLDASSASFFPFEAGWMDHAAPQNPRRRNGGLVLGLKKAERPVSTPAVLEGLLVWEAAGGRRGAEIRAPVAAAASGPPWGPAAFAFLGGLLLNLMPCVFPVLSIKAVSLLGYEADHPQGAWGRGAAYTLGILVSLWALAGALVALRAAGMEIGWGFQLQSPIFVAFGTAFLLILALNLLGMFEIAGSWMGWGQSLTRRKGMTGSFFTGVLATLIATPCTAPFMGAAVGYALTQPPATTLFVFTGLGLGLAAPYAVISVWPGLGRRLPEPGRWMETFRQLMAFPLLATVAWLAGVFGRQVGVPGLGGAAGGAVILWFAVWAWRRARASPWRWSGLAVGLLAVTAAWPRAGGIAWVEFTPEKMIELHSSGKPVFVDFTAAWCLSCQVNKKVALESSRVKARFRELGVVPVRADWTKEDPAITRELARFGRSGVPFYVLYSGRPDDPGTPLPEILTPRIVLDALEKIGRNGGK